ncbi:bifunctional phosphoribosylaminoimidazolecarboxamide formyltransferase/IMP cyclohydrolase [Halocatena marina]|uniref:bifunctional phosphoribosylaminoimidazolecarboxamide formyltransferase/IMP cyclohydrolase n=1 Tax=Halocatena marina TaxID=2934937 RepID=UPI0034A18BC0
MMRIAGMAGNRGRNLLNIADRAPNGVEFSVVLTDNESAPVLTEAAERGIPTEVVERSGEDESRDSHEERILARLAGYDIDLVCLDGYMRVLTNTFLDSAPLTLNVHPSLLPSFKGMDAWGDALAAGVTVTGCTVHVVTEEVDGGPIVTQEPVPVYEDDTAADLKDRVLYDGEFVAYPRAVRAVAEGRVTVDDGTVHIDGDESGAFPARWIETGDRTASLRYGENPHQDAALYADTTCTEASVVHADQLNEGAKALSYNNYNDADGALNLIKEFEEPAAAVIKHTNPAGCATAETLADAYEDALATDPQSAFGGIVALNRECDATTAERIIDSFKEIVVAPGYTDAALDVLRSKENLRVLDVGDAYDQSETLVEKPLVGGRLVQERDRQQLTRDALEFVTEREPTDEQIETMLFAWSVTKHVKSNAIVFASETETVGIGMGQVSRVDAVRLAGLKADEHADGKSAAGAVMASDAFFPFPDGIETAAEHGIEAVIQPGGSVNDEDVIAAADELGMAMAFTGQRCFKHE